MKDTVVIIACMLRLQHGRGSRKTADLLERMTALREDFYPWIDAIQQVFCVIDSLNGQRGRRHRLESVL